VRAAKKNGLNHGEDRLFLEIDRQHGLVSYDAEILVTPSTANRPAWVCSTRRDLALAIRDQFLKTQLYAHLARQLGWMPSLLLKRSRMVTPNPRSRQELGSRPGTQAVA
jgi:hypothetical protein